LARILLGPALLAVFMGLPVGPAAAEGHREPVWAYCLRVFDGDTIEVLMGRQRERVRLIGVDAPEVNRPGRPGEPFGREAAAFAESLMHHEKLRLEFDEERRDRHGRLLAYVYLEDGLFVNAELIRLGYAEVYRRFRYRHKEYFFEMQDEARARRRGIWAGAKAGR